MPRSRGLFWGNHVSRLCFCRTCVAHMRDWVLGHWESEFRDGVWYVISNICMRVPDRYCVCRKTKSLRRRTLKVYKYPNFPATESFLLSTPTSIIAPSEYSHHQSHLDTSERLQPSSNKQTLLKPTAKCISNSPPFSLSSLSSSPLQQLYISPHLSLPVFQTKSVY